MRIAIVGWGVEGQSAFKFFGPSHEYLIVNEEPRDDFPAQSDKINLRYLKEERPTGMVGNVTDLSYLDGLASCDRIIYSPSSYKNLQKVYGQDKSFWDKTTTVQNLFFEKVRTKHIIGVTGTKGKGTTSTLIHHILEAAGKKVFLGGNVGNSMLDFAGEVETDDWVVLELSSFQLHNFRYSPHIGVCLMVVPEHLDWHGDMAEYIDAKANLFRHQNTDDIAIYFTDNKASKKIAGASPGRKVPYYRKPGASVRADGMIVIAENDIEVMAKSEVKLIGEHNLQNICAAITAVYEAIGSLDKAKAVLSSFSGLEHRLELVRSFEGIKYYDDSFGTTPETAIVALRAFVEPKIVILGGSDKGAPFDELADAVIENNVKHVVLIGETGPHIGFLLKNRNFTNITTGLSTMPAMVAEARKHAVSGDVVLLSTGCASFGLFKDYKDRGNQFNEAVNNL